MTIDLDVASDQYINCGDHASVCNIFNGGGSWCAWIKPGDFTDDDGRVFSKGTSAMTWLAVHSANPRLWFRRAFSVADGEWCTDNNTIVTAVWQHICVTYDDGATTNDPTFYINSVSVNVNEAATPAGTRVNDTIALRIGSGGAAKSYDGLIADARAYNRVLTAEEVALLAAGYRGPLGGEVLWLSMNEARGILTPGTLTQGTHLLPDLSANTNDGDPYGNPVMVASDCPRFGSWIGASITTFLAKSLAGVFVATGTVAKKTSRVLAGSLVLTGAITKKAKKALAGAITFTGAITKKAKKALAGAITFAGTLGRRLILFIRVFFDATPTARVKYGASTDSDDNIAEFDATPTGKAKDY